MDENCKQNRADSARDTNRLMREQIAAWMGYASLEEKEEDDARLIRIMENRAQSNKESDNG